MKIQDGSGFGNLAKVDESNRLWTDSLIIEEAIEKAFAGDAYNVNTGNITLTSGNASGVLYMDNASQNDIVISAFFYLLGVSTGGSGNFFVDVYRNTTAGTLVSSGTSFSAVNRNFGSANTLQATLLKGAEGLTITDGDIVIQSLFTSLGRNVLNVGAIVLKPGNSIAFEATPQSGNTSQVVQFGLSCYERT